MNIAVQKKLRKTSHGHTHHHRVRSNSLWRLHSIYRLGQTQSHLEHRQSRIHSIGWDGCTRCDDVPHRERGEQALQDVTGGYWDAPNTPVKANKNTYNWETQQRLWNSTKQLVAE
jgi:hypothetical protein